MNYRDSLCNLISTLPPDAVIAEIGVHRGRTSQQILSRFPRVTLHMVDLWGEWRQEYGHTTIVEQQEYRRMATDNTAKWRDRRHIVISDSISAMQFVPDCDLVFIDADHSYDAVKGDLAWWDKVKPGGILCGHDYNENHPGVPKAVDERFGDKISVAEGSIWWITKP